MFIIYLNQKQLESYFIALSLSLLNAAQFDV